MSTPTLIPDPAVLGDLTPQGSEGLPMPESTGVGSRLLSGTAVLGASVLVERGTGFLANILAARFGGAPVFGAYALGISTANNISTYAAGGIGATATRFSGKYNLENGGYSTFTRVLTTVTVISAVIAAIALWAGAAPIANLLHKPELVHLLRLASLPAVGMIVLESARGFFVGQRRLMALGVLSISVGAGMLLLLPAMASTHHPTGMIVVQGTVTGAAVLLCVLLARPLQLFAPASSGRSQFQFGSMLREVWGFGLVQLLGLLSANLAGWWLTALVARGDTTLAQMGFFAIASQLRNLVGILPALLTESSYAVMAGEDAKAGDLPDRVMALCTYASVMVAYVLAGLGMLVVPWLLSMFYGATYQQAAVAAAVGLGVAVVQMGNAPTSARMSIVSVRWVAIGNTVWAVLVALVGTAWMHRGGSAAAAMAVFFGGHVLLALFVLLVLHSHRHLPHGLWALFAINTVGIVALQCMALLRAAHPEHMGAWTLAMFVALVVSVAILLAVGRRHDWMIALRKPLEMLNRMVRRVPGLRLKAEGASR